jgi:DNA polymerase/3'-5' exonuclease PolX
MMEYTKALTIAEEARETLAPFCERITIAGSIRRRREHCKDIELVAIPKMVATGLFSDEPVVHPDFCAVVDSWQRVKGQATGRYTQRILPGGMVLDLFMADQDNHGAILLIRTGDAAFSKRFMGWTLRRHGYEQRDGYIWQGGVKVGVPEERDVFRLVRKPFVEPSDRIGAR